MKTVIFLCLLLFFNMSYSQTQIGDDIDGEAAGDSSGWSISLSSDGTILAIGTGWNDGNGENAGHVRVYKNESGIWTQIGDDIDGEAAGDFFGHFLSLSSDGLILAIGGIGNDGNGTDSGHVRVYNYDNSLDTWTQIGEDIEGESAYDYFGIVSLSSDGNNLAIIATGGYSERVSVYRNKSGIWTQIGEDIYVETTNSSFTPSISLSSDGTLFAVGASGDDGNGIPTGQVRIYKNIANTWTQIGEDIYGEAEYDAFGKAVSLSSDGSIVAIGGSVNEGNGQQSGHVRVFKNESGTWTQIGDDIDGEAAGDRSGVSVSLSSDGSIVAIGAIRNDNINGANSGHVRVYRNESGIWAQIGEDIDGKAEHDLFGHSIGLSSDGAILAIGALGSEGVIPDPGYVQVYDLSNSLSISNISLMKTNIYPNPAKEHFTIQLQDGNQLEKAVLYNALGQFIKSHKTITIPTTGMAKGIYFLKIKTTLGESIKKVIIE